MPRPKPGRPATPSRTASPVMQELIRLIDASPHTRGEVAKKAGFSVDNFKVWKRGTTGASLPLVEAAGQALGYKLVWQKDDSE